MIKKIFIFILVLIFFYGFNLNVNADENVFEGDIISEIGIGKDTMIFTEGVSEVSGKVNWNEAGTYEVLCKKEGETPLFQGVKQGCFYPINRLFFRGVFVGFLCLLKCVKKHLVSG